MDACVCVCKTSGKCQDISVTTKAAAAAVAASVETTTVNSTRVSRGSIPVEKSFKGFTVLFALVHTHTPFFLYAY